MAISDAATAIHELRGYLDEIDAIRSRVDGKTTISYDEKLDLQSDLKALKTRLKAAAKRGARNEMESAFLLPALTRAAAHFSVATNSHPINNNWSGALFSVRWEIANYLGKLEAQYPKL